MALDLYLTSQVFRPLVRMQVYMRTFGFDFGLRGGGRDGVDEGDGDDGEMEDPVLDLIQKRAG